METGLLTNRELAGLIWLAVLAVLVLWQPSRDKLIGSVAAASITLVAPVVLVPLILYAAWLAGAVWLADRVGLWGSELLKPTVLWVIFAGVGLYFSMTKALQQEDFFKSALLAAVGASVFVEFFVSFQSFPLVIELIAQPIVAVFAMMAIVAARRPGQEIVVKASSWITISFGLAAVAWVMWNVITRWQEIDGAGVIKEILLPFWLTPIALAFVYLLALYAGYEQAFKRIDWKADERSTWRQKAALVSVAGIRMRKLRRLHGAAQVRLADETSFKGARRAAAAAQDG